MSSERARVSASRHAETGNLRACGRSSHRSFTHILIISAHARASPRVSPLLKIARVSTFTPLFFVRSKSRRRRRRRWRRRRRLVGAQPIEQASASLALACSCALVDERRFEANARNQETGVTMRADESRLYSNNTKKLGRIFLLIDCVKT